LSGFVGRVRGSAIADVGAPVERDSGRAPRESHLLALSRLRVADTSTLIVDQS
jgi:hypothetical protein